MTFIAEEIGRWWGSNPATKKPEEIDILILGDADAMVCECKYTNAKFDERELKKMQESATCIQKPNIYYKIFSKNGATPAVHKIIDGNPHYSLVTLDDLYAGD